ncbi:MAG: hypothetical protein KGM24_07425 [Elusimicrobia bacterium]|nr:hypothetical protein [Elusimicrobiota bacterium]
MSPAAIWKRWVALFEEDEGPEVPRYDPVHLAAVLVACLAVIGVLFWLLWTLLCYDGGLPSKVGPFFAVLLRLKTPASYGWLGTPDRQGLFEGWLANLAALAVSALVVALLYKADRRRASRPR